MTTIKSFKIFNLVVIGVFAAVMGATYILISYLQYGSDHVYHTFNMDVGFFINHVYALMHHYQLFPDSLENLGVDYKYHYFEAHCKYLLALVMGTQKASLVFSVVIFAALLYLLIRGCSRKLNFLLVLFGVTSPFLFWGDGIYAPGHLFGSDFIQNHNTILGVIFILLWVGSGNLYFKLVLGFLSGFIKFPLIPAIFVLEIFNALIKDEPLRAVKTEWKRLAAILLSLIASYFVFGSNEAHMSFEFRFSHDYWTYIKTLVNLWWYYLPLFLYGYQLYRERGRLRWIQSLLFLGLLAVPFVGQFILIRLVPVEYYSQDNKQLYLWIYFAFTLYFIERIDYKQAVNQILPVGFSLVALVNIPYFIFMFQALGSHHYEKMSEHLDNTEIIQATKKVTNENEVIGLNFIDNPLRKNKQLQVCAVVRNQLFVSNLLYGASSEKEKVLERKNWADIQSFIQKGSPDLSPALDLLLLDKRKHNFNLQVLTGKYEVLDQTPNYYLLERR